MGESVCELQYIGIAFENCRPISGGFFFVFAAQPKYASPSAETISPVSAS